jgi:hypothetical protein
METIPHRSDAKVIKPALEDTVDVSKSSQKQGKEGKACGIFTGPAALICTIKYVFPICITKPEYDSREYSKLNSMTERYIDYMKGYCGTSYSSEFYFRAIPCMWCDFDRMRQCLIGYRRHASPLWVAIVEDLRVVFACLLACLMA